MLRTRISVVEQSWTPITAKSAREVVIYLACNSNIVLLSFLAFQWPSPRGTPGKYCVLFMSRSKIVSGLPYKIVIESWNTHASSSSQEALLWKAAAWGSREKRKRSQSVSLTVTLPASYSLFLLRTINVIPKLNFVNSLLICRFWMSIKTDGCGPFPHCLSLPLQHMYSQ